MDFNVADFIDSPNFWRAVLAFCLVWALKNSRQIFDGLKYIVDSVMALFRGKWERNGRTDQMVADLLRQRAGDDGFDARYAVDLLNNIIKDKEQEIAKLESELEVSCQRNASLTNLAIEKSEESAQVVRLLNGTIAVFNTLAENRAVIDERLIGAIERLCDIFDGNNDQQRKIANRG